MGRWARWLVMAVCVAVCPGLTGSVGAVFPPPVKDDGKFFSKEAIDKANKKIKEIYEKYKKDVIIETIASLTTDQEKKFKEEGKTKFFARLALDRSREIGLNGIYLLISKDPRHLQVHMDPETQKRQFTTADRKKLLDAMVAQFGDGKFDAGLEAALKTIETALAAHSK